MNIPRYIIMPISIFYLCQLTALTHHVGHRFSPTSANSTQRGFCRVIDMKSHNLFSKLVPGRYISGPQYILSNLLLQFTARFYPNQYLPFLSHTAHAFFSASIHSPSALLHSLCTPLGIIIIAPAGFWPRRPKPEEAS